MTSNLTDLLALSRRDLAAAVREHVPEATIGPGRDSLPATGLVGGRAAAITRLRSIDPATYARTRNHVAGRVTMLSPWIRHGVLSLAEVRDAALACVPTPEQATKLVSELAWRDYWREVHRALGDGIHHDIEPPAMIPRRPPEAVIPPDVLEGRTGMACIDAFVHRLHDTGWLHNHERMWLASWLVHVRGIHWRAGADWFLEHLLDGDPASNHLSWQWIAGTFSAKPYLFNRENLETYTSGCHCHGCDLVGRCDVEGSYEDLTARFFRSPDHDPADTPDRPREPAAPRPPLRIRPAPPTPSPAPSARPLVWLTLDSASAGSPAAAAFPSAPRLVVLDPAWLAEERPSLKRLVFLFECLADVPGIEVLHGDPAEILPTVAGVHGCDAIAVADSPCPRVRRTIETLTKALPVAEIAWPSFCDRARVQDLGRFSRYWQKVSASALRPTPA